MLPLDGSLLHRPIRAPWTRLHVQQGEQLLHQRIPNLRTSVHSDELRNNP